MAGWRECVQLMTVGEKRRCWVPQSLAYKGAGGPADRHGGVRHRAARDARQSRRSRRPTSRSRRPTRSRRRAGSPTRCCGRAPARAIRPPGRAGDRPLHRLDDRRKDVRQLGRARHARRHSTSTAYSGWTEGVELMVEGERTRFWIPAGPRLQGRGRQPARHARLRHRADQDRVGTFGLRLRTTDPEALCPS